MQQWQVLYALGRNLSCAYAIKCYTFISSIPGSRLVLVLYLQKCTLKHNGTFCIGELDSRRPQMRGYVKSYFLLHALNLVSLVLSKFYCTPQTQCSRNVTTKTKFVSFLVHELATKSPSVVYTFERTCRVCKKKEIDMAVYVLFTPDDLWVFLITQKRQCHWQGMFTKVLVCESIEQDWCHVPFASVTVLKTTFIN